MSKQTNTGTTRGFTLVEVMIAGALSVVVVGTALAAFLALTKQQRLIEDTNDLAIALQRAEQRIQIAIATSPAAPEIFVAQTTTTARPTTPITTSGSQAGLTFRIPSGTNCYVKVTGGATVLSGLTNPPTTGYVNTATAIQVSKDSPQTSSEPILVAGATCPSAPITTGALPAGVFRQSPVRIDPTQYFQARDIIRIPSTGFGNSVSAEIVGLVDNGTTVTLNLRNRLSSTATWRLPNDTWIPATTLPCSLYTVVQTDAGPLRTGDLVYFPDETDLTNYKVLARDIVPQNIRQDPSDPASALDPFPFIYNTITRELIINLQCLPRSNPVSGRATVGARTRAWVRSDPTQRNT